MGHHIRAIIGPTAALARAADFGVQTTAVPLTASVAWLPMPDSVLDRLTEHTTLPRAPADERFEHFTGVLPAVCAELSRIAPIAYVETEYFGGAGTQVATVFEQGLRVIECSSVNEALAAIGVRRTASHDEWDTVGLGNHRRMPDE